MLKANTAPNSDYQRRAYQLQKRSASYGGDYKLVIVPVHI